MKPSRVDLIIRADATPAIGAGHVMRMTTLALSWRRGGYGQVMLTGTVAIPFVAEHAAAAGFRMDTDLPTGPRAAVLVIDHYDQEVREVCAARRDFRLRVLVDDLGEAVPEGIDVIWNPNTYGDAKQYPGFPGPVLTGAGHVPVRPDLPVWRGGDPDLIAVMSGGGGLQPAVREAIGLMAERLPRMKWLAPRSWGLGGWASVDETHAWDGIVRAGRLITSAGITMWEAAAVGIPVVILEVAPNQARSASWARAHGIPTAILMDMDSSRLARDLTTSLANARPLPRVMDGSAEVSRAIAALAAGAVLG